VIDTIAGAILRIFNRLEQIDGELRLYRQRLRALEKLANPAPIGIDDMPKVTPSSARQHRGNRTPLWNLKDGGAADPD
jgi:hypothetical protein